jgi:hypothetical protein
LTRFCESATGRGRSRAPEEETKVLERIVRGLDLGDCGGGSILLRDALERPRRLAGSAFQT